jgi:hypothetical protein
MAQVSKKKFLQLVAATRSLYAARTGPKFNLIILFLHPAPEIKQDNEFNLSISLNSGKETN